MTRIAVGAFLHETNTFAPTKATYDDFVHGGGWPSMAHGADVLKVMRRINVGLAGFVEAAEANGWELVPTISAAASPSAHVTRDAFERVMKEMIDGIAAAGPIDAVYLDLHGAMVAEHYDDGEGETLARVRTVIGKDLPLVVSLDLHANVSPEMMAHADALIAYRTYPHVDMADTGRACARHLALLLKTKTRFAKAFRQLPFLIPISWQCTNDQPTRGIYEKLAALKRRGADIVLCARFSGRGLHGLRAERICLWKDAGRRRRCRRQDRRPRREPRRRFRRPHLFAR
jgi:microcystin degradation protein MlrC